MNIPKLILEKSKRNSFILLMFIYLAENRSLIDVINCSIDDIVKFMGYSNRSGKIDIKIKNLIKQLEQDEIIKIDDKIDTSLSKFHSKHLVKLYINHNYFDVNDSFCQITVTEINKILNYKDYITIDKDERNVMPDKLLYILTYIRMNKLRRAKTQEAHPNRKPEFFFKQIKYIAEDLGISTRTVSSGVIILEKLDIIVSKQMKRYKDDSDNWHTGVTLFVDRYDGWEQELKWGVDLLKSGKKIKYN